MLKLRFGSPERSAPKPHSWFNSELAPRLEPASNSPERPGQFQNYQSVGAIGFSFRLSENALMRPSPQEMLPIRLSPLRILAAGITLLAWSLTLLADTPALLRHVPMKNCYCHCAESNLRGGCTKMCDSKKLTPRWQARSCAKPHMQTPSRDSNAGPRFPHPGRAEHARVTNQF